MRFKNGDRCRIIYTPLPKIERFNTTEVYACPKCGASIWKTKNLRKSSKEVSFSCVNCDYWFTTTTDKVERVLGVV
jgi:predicted RNA-binding Zn-ribbon protein involved in translation (DUF1610 family)